MSGLLEREKFYLTKMAWRNDDTRLFEAMVVTEEEPWKLFTVADEVTFEKVAGDSWLIIRKDGTREHARIGDYWLKWSHHGCESQYGVLEKGSPDYYQFNVCFGAGIIAGALSVIDPVR